MPNDPKWRLIARRAGATIAEVGWLFIHMMDNAAGAKFDGKLRGWNDEVVAIALDMDEEKVRAIRTAMQGVVLDGEELTGWKGRQEIHSSGTGAERTRRWRERQATQANAAADPPAVPANVIEEPAPAAPTKSRKRADGSSRTRMTEDMQPSAAMRATAERHQMTPQEFRTEFQHFRSWHLAKGDASASWDHSWVTWVMKWKDRVGRSTTVTRSGGKPNGFVEAARNILERIEDAEPRNGAPIASTLPDAAFGVAPAPLVALPPGTIGPQSILDLEPIRTDRRRESDLD